MNCNEAKVLMMKYLDKNITESDESKLMKHLDTCSECSKEFNSLNEIFKMVDDLEDVEAPKDIEKL